ncbi:MAG TPA: RNA polymerase sigma factor [Capsulimonadaceae bacterium]|nr:RNA polymerase sigma factor [Capsulimonadaceae bacterium]
MIPLEVEKSGAKAKGDRQIRFDELYGAHGARIFRLCHRLCRNPTDAEDLAQEVFVAAFRGLPRFAGRASPSTWLYKIALNRWRAWKGKDRLNAASLDQSDEPIGPDPTHASLERIAMDRAMAALPAVQREALLLVKGEGLTCREAASVLGLPEGTVKFRVYQAIQKLQSSLATVDSPVAGPGKEA